jgi:hypothetical protein
MVLRAGDLITATDLRVALTESRYVLRQKSKLEMFGCGADLSLLAVARYMPSPLQQQSVIGALRFALNTANHKSHVTRHASHITCASGPVHSNRQSVACEQAH